MKIFRLVEKFLRFLFSLLYHQFAWSYDFVAALVSGGQWKNWVTASAGFIEGSCILELGPGPGHLQSALTLQCYKVFGLEQSPQMIRIAKNRLKKIAPSRIRLVRARSQQIPLASDSFDCILSTFPSEYIADPQTIQEINRVLKPGGLLVIVLSARLKPANWRFRLLNSLYRKTARVFESSSPFTSFDQLYRQSGFSPQQIWHPARDCEILIFKMRKINRGLKSD